MPLPSEFECIYLIFHAPSFNVNDSFSKCTARIMHSNERKIIQNSHPQIECSLSKFRCLIRRIFCKDIKFKRRKYEIE